MKKIYLLFIFNSVLQYAIAQPVVTTTLQVGDVFTSEYLYTTGAYPGAFGANQTWDYSYLTDSASAIPIKVINASGTPYVGDFPGAQYATSLGDSLYSYFEMVDGSPAGLGLETSTEKFTYAHPLTTIHYPFTYTDAFTDSVTLFIDASFFSGKSKLIDTILVTGYGTLKLPGNTYSNVLQTREISSSSEIITLPGGIMDTIPATSDTTYGYYINGQPGAILFYSIENGHINVIDYLKSSSLPLHFISFTALPGNEMVQLNWQTGDEFNTDQFDVQRSIDGANFISLGKVVAGGSGYHNYNYTDTRLKDIERIYYRIKETDKDGRSIYSNIISCNLSGLSGVKLYPNPANNEITLTGIGNFSSLKLYSLSGQQLRYVNIKGESITVPVTEFSPGVYIAELGNGSKTFQLRFLKK